MLPWQVMTALAVAKETLQRREAASPRALALAAERQGKAMFVVPEVISPSMQDMIQESACCMWGGSKMSQLCGSVECGCLSSAALVAGVNLQA